MRKLVGLGISGLMVFGISPAAYADHRGGDRYGYDERGDCNREGNCNDQSRRPGRDDNHKAFSPDLKDSPTTLYFCLPGSTCYFDGKKDDRQPDERERTAGPDLMCVVRSLPYHCDPKPE